MREKCELLDGRELVHMHTGIQGQKDGRFFSFFSSSVRETRQYLFLTGLQCNPVCMNVTSLNAHWMTIDCREMKKDSCAFPVVKT